MPHDLLERALAQEPKSVEKLSPLVDYFVELSNDDDICIVNPPGETWESFKETWVQ